ncbi:MAG: BrnT family toxin [Desulfobacteraceae bacterium]|nr:MAG: BrnT family toxin [Desulfobacteraceae bacterium]
MCRKFDWDDEKSRINKIKHGIDFNVATELWNDINRVEIQASYPLEDRSILMGKIEEKV